MGSRADKPRQIENREVTRIESSPEGKAKLDHSLFTKDKLITLPKEVVQQAYDNASKRRNKAYQELKMASTLSSMRKWSDERSHHQAIVDTLGELYKDQANTEILGEIVDHYYTDVSQDCQKLLQDAQSTHLFLDNIPDKFLTDLSAEIGPKVSPSRKDYSIYLNIREACNKIRVFRNLFSKHISPQQAEKYGNVTKNQAVTAAIELREILNNASCNNNFRDKTLINPFCNDINNYYRDAGLS